MTTPLRTVVRQFLDEHRKAVFATIDDKGEPRTSLMLYAIDDDLSVYFGTRRSFKKYPELLAHPKVSLSVIEEKLDPLRVVDIQGTAAEVPVAETEKTLHFFKGKNMSRYYVESADDFVMFKITPTVVRWLDATSGELSIQYLDI
jgi:uncharacterized pyridoxamine 5'-phosphate oxidase family protein